ncbi:hypothetical protein QPJ96_21930 (plasmid) [Pantoea agglomerans]|nr:hypothetical protein [Pantoea agglomerans]WIL44513.1 hypothetical protein QPJ96_21930 [Pantoea agglomerans]
MTSPAQDNLFLACRLATAEKQRLFPKPLAPDVRWLLAEGRNKWVQAELTGKLQCLRKSASGDVVNMVKLAGWIYRTLSDSEWHWRKPLRLNPGVWGLFVKQRVR